MKNSKTFTVREVGTDINMFQTYEARPIVVFAHRNLTDTSKYFVENVDASVKIPLDIFLRDLCMESRECEVILTYEKLMEKMEEVGATDIKSLDFTLWHEYGVDLCVRIEMEDGSVIRHNC